MSRLLVHPAGPAGRIHHITPQSAGWRYVGFDVHGLAAGETVGAATGQTEVCLVLVSGTARIRAAGQDFGSVGGRTSPFDGSPASVYVPAGADWSATAEGPVIDYIYEPSEAVVLDDLLEMHVKVQVYRILLESSASEHAARMTAMDAATNNADDMIAFLTLRYNKARQEAITKELIDIVGGAEALR